MRASTLIAQLLEIMEDHHCDPEIEVQTGVEHNYARHYAKIITGAAWYAEYLTRGTEPIIVIRNNLKVRDGFEERY